MGVVKMVGGDGSGCVRKMEIESEDRNKDTYGWTVDNGSVGGHSTSEFRNSSNMNLQLRSIGALDLPRRPSLHAHRC